MRLLALAVAATLAIGCSNAPTEAADETKGETDSMIVGGTTANITQWPGMAQLEAETALIGCGGSLIAPEWVVTAAHCFDDTKVNGGFANVTFGRQSSDTADGETIPVLEAFRHESFVLDTMVNDIALIHLASKATETPAKVMTPSQWATLDKAGTMLTVVGWGATQEGGDITPSLRQVSVPLIASTSCATMDTTQITITDKMFCAGFATGGKDACQGDSGGPIFMQVGGAPVQVGVVSFGDGCARANAPGVYTQLAGHFDWINAKTGNALGTTATKPATPTSGDSDATETKPAKTTGDVGDSGDDDDDTSTTAEPKKKTSRSSNPTVSQGCSITHARSPSSSAGPLAGLLVLAAAVLARRRLGRAA